MFRFSKYWKLFKIMLKSFSLDVLFQSSRQEDPKKRRTKNIVTGIFFLLLFGYMTVFLVLMLNTLYTVSHAVNAPLMLLQTVTIITLSMVFFFGTMNVMASFYYSKDLEAYQTLPVSQTEIVGARFSLTLLWEYLICLALALPGFLIWGIRTGVGVDYYVFMVFILLLLPIVPLTLSAVLVMVLMRFTRFFNNRDVVNIVTMIIMLLVLLGGQLYLQSVLMQDTIHSDQVAGMEGFSNIMGFIFLGTGFIPGILSQGGLEGLLFLGLYFLSTLAYLAIFMFVANAIYYKGVHVLGSSKQRVTQSHFKHAEKEIRPKKKFLAYALREWRILYRTPIFFLNNVLTIFLPVLILILPIATMSMAPSDQGGISMGELLELIRHLPLATDPTAQAMAFFGALCLAGLFASMNSMAASGISREGRCFNYLKILPMSFGDQLMVKLGMYCTASFVSCFIILIPLFILVPMPAWLVVMVTVIALWAAVMPNLLGLIVELYFPKLLWDNEQKAVKQNLNVLFQVLAGMGITVGGILGMAFLAHSLPLWLSFLITAGAPTLINVTLFMWLTQVGPKRMMETYV